MCKLWEMNIYSGLQTVLLVTLFGLCLHIGTRELKEQSLYHVTALQTAIRKDWLMVLKAKPEILPLMANLSQIQTEIPPQDRIADLWSRHLNLPFKTSMNPKAQYRLEILILSDTEGKSLAATIQYSVTDLVTGDLVAEIGRRYPLHP